MNNERCTALLLSGGGMYGAYGAGFLKGWSSISQDRCYARPRFDIVTGVSTGALIATFAFLGSEYDNELKRAYTRHSTSDIMRWRSSPCALFSNSLATTKPLEQLINTYLTDSIIDEVKAETERNPHRSLWVGLVNLDRGVFQPFDLTAIAASNHPGRYQRYRRIVLASASIPVLFPPVIIDDEMYVDGAAREWIFFRAIDRHFEARAHAQHQYQRHRRTVLASASIPLLFSPVIIDNSMYVHDVARGWGSFRAIDPVLESSVRAARCTRPRIYLIVNTEVGVPDTCVQNHVLAIAERTASVMADENLVGNLYRIYAESLHRETDFRMIHVPSGECPVPNGELYDTSVMQCLFRKGKARGKQSHPWSMKPPRLHAPVNHAASLTDYSSCCHESGSGTSEHSWK